MEITGYLPQVIVDYPTEEESLKLAVQKFREDFPDARITAVDGVDVVDMCENCELPILEGEEYAFDMEGVYWHKKCF